MIRDLITGGYIPQLIYRPTFPNLNETKIQDAWTIKIDLQEQNQTQEDNMLRDQEKKIIIEQLETKKKDLLNSKENYIYYLAHNGDSLNKILTEIREIEIALNALQTPCKKCCDDDEDDEE